MLLTLSTQFQPATDLGYLLHKNPARVQTFELNFGKAHVFYPEATLERCTVALLLDIDPIGLSRKAHKGTPLEPYVNDRPYVASSFLSVALGDVFSTAMAGRSKDRQLLADTPLPFEVAISVLPSRGGEDLLHKLFSPLGYALQVKRLPLDDAFPEWGESPYYQLQLSHTLKLSELLTHLYVLIPVLDDTKHYYVGTDEIEKLLKKGEGWLEKHPERTLITRRYLRHSGALIRPALEILSENDPVESGVAEEVLESSLHQGKKQPLNAQRLEAVLNTLKESGARRVLDLGCGEGNLLRLLVKENQFSELVGVDVSPKALEIAERKLERLPEMQRKRIKLLQGALTYRDKRLSGFDAAALVEVIEHLDIPRLKALERVVFEFAKPRMVIVTTPNADYNVRFTSLPAGKMRHRDHRFEWGREEFQAWAKNVSEKFGYSVRFEGVGEEDMDVGTPTQMVIFEKLAVK
jgi:3' terminal RNA ribose 2'-O-methyltransferase Hen1